MDETTKDVVPTEGGERIAPQSNASPAGAGQDSPGGKSTIEALSQEVKNLSGMVRAFQSDEDRRIPTIERELKSQSEQLELYHKRRASGMSEREAQRAEVLDTLVNERIAVEPNRLTVSDDSVPADQMSMTVADYLSPILQATGLADTDAGVIEIVRTVREPAKQMAAIVELSESRKQADETPANPGAVMPDGGGKASEGDTLESVSEELNRLQFEPATPATRARIRELSKKHKELLPRR